MALTFNWTIPTTEYNKADGGIFVAHYRVTAVDGEYTASAYGSCSFTPDASATGFIPYANVTEAEVLNWCWANGVDKAETEANLGSQIDAAKNPTSESGVPWA